jgi:HEAT repeat protein
VSSSDETPKTAEELLAELAQDPIYLEQQAARDKERRTRLARNQIDAQPMFDDLDEIGVGVESFNELNSQKLSPEAVQVLLDWLPRLGNLNVKETIIRILTKPEARPAAASTLIDEFWNCPELRWEIGNALATVADDSVFDEVRAISQDKELGSDREMVVVALGNMKNPEAVNVALELTNDPDVAGHAVIALGELRAPVAAPRLRELEKHPVAWIRRETARALRRIEKST